MALGVHGAQRVATIGEMFSARSRLIVLEMASAVCCSSLPGCIEVG